MSPKYLKMMPEQLIYGSADSSPPEISHVTPHGERSCEPVSTSAWEQQVTTSPVLVPCNSGRFSLWTTACNSCGLFSVGFDRVLSSNKRISMHPIHPKNCLLLCSEFKRRMIPCEESFICSFEFNVTVISGWQCPYAHELCMLTQVEVWRSLTVMCVNQRP